MNEPLEPSPAINIPAQSRAVRGRPFPPGNRLGGRKLGSRNKATIALQALLDDEGLKLTRKAVEMALAGDTVALRICLERLLPPARERRITLDMPDLLSSASEIPRATAAVIQAVASGELTPGEGQTVGTMLELHRRALESAELEIRIAALEARSDGGRVR